MQCTEPYSRRASLEEAVPPELQSPIAVATHLLDKVPSPVTDTPSDDCTEGKAADTSLATSPVSDEKVRRASFALRITLTELLPISEPPGGDGLSRWSRC